MSFYGQMRWTDSTIGNYFYGIRLTADMFTSAHQFNKNPPEGEETVGSQDRYLYPHEDLSKLTVNRGNHWIGIAPIDCVGDDHVTCSGFNLFHNAPLTTGLTADSFQQVLEGLTKKPSQSVTVLKSGGYIKISSPKFDVAGHWVGKDLVDTKYFQLPNQSILIIHPDNGSDELILNSNNQFEFKHDDYIKMSLNSAKNRLTVEHVTPLLTLSNTYDDKLIPQNGMIKYIPEKDEVPTVHQEICQGDYFQVFQASLDSAGHVVSITPYMYKLAVSELDEELTKMLDWYNKFLKDAGDKDSDITTLKEIQDAIKTVDNNYLKQTQNVTNILNVLGIGDMLKGDALSEVNKDFYALIDYLAGRVPGSDNQAAVRGSGFFKALHLYFSSAFYGAEYAGIIGRLKTLENIHGINTK